MQEIENNIFKKGKLNVDKLIAYGFKREDNSYVYKTAIMNNKFTATIMIDNQGNVNGKVIDVNFNEEYLNFRNKNLVGEFVSSVREEYEKILKDIYKNCFTEQDFILDQTNRISKLISKKYNVMPEFPWQKSPGSAIFRHSDNQKWFAVILDVDKSKVINSETGLIEVLNLKLDNAPMRAEENGIYPAYHMNKKYWISIILDDTLSDEYILELIEESFELTN